MPITQQEINMVDEKVSKRDQVKNAIAECTFTKKQIAENLGMSIGSVSSQMTYLRWMGNFIMWNDDKIMTFCTEEEFDAWKAAQSKKSGTTAAVSKLTPDEQAVKLAKTIATQGKSLENWEKKLVDAEEVLESEDNEENQEENQDYVDECNANIVLVKIKIKRNIAKADALPDAEEAATRIAEAAEESAGEEAIEEAADSDEELM